MSDQRRTFRAIVVKNPIPGTLSVGFRVEVVEPVADDPELDLIERAIEGAPRLDALPEGERE